MKNSEVIRQMSEHELARFLFTWTANAAAKFITGGGRYLLNVAELECWLDGEEWEITETKPLEEK